MYQKEQCTSLYLGPEEEIDHLHLLSLQGVEGGNALWSLLIGEKSFSGRLPQAWPHNAG